MKRLLILCVAFTVVASALPASAGVIGRGVRTQTTSTTETLHEAVDVVWVRTPLPITPADAGSADVTTVNATHIINNLFMFYSRDE